MFLLLCIFWSFEHLIIYTHNIVIKANDYELAESDICEHKSKSKVQAKKYNNL